MELQDRIIREASVLFFTKGVKSMTMSDVANELGISKRTLYEVFRDKDELVEKCVHAHIEKADQDIKEVTDHSEDVIDTLMRIYAKHLREVQTVNKSVIRDLKKYHSHIYRKIEEWQKGGIEMFIPLFNRGVEEGLIRDDVNMEIILWLLRSQFKALIDDEYIPTDKYSTEEFFRVIILNFIRGIATPSGNEKVDAIIENLRKEYI